MEYSFLEWINSLGDININLKSFIRFILLYLFIFFFKRREERKLNSFSKKSWQDSFWLELLLIISIIQLLIDLFNTFFLQEMKIFLKRSFNMNC